MDFLRPYHSFENIKEKRLVKDHDQQEKNIPTQIPTDSNTQAQPFDTLDLPEKVMAGISDAGFIEMTPVQDRSLPLALAGKDVCAQAQTGTGKTAAFLITIFARILSGEPSPKRREPLALILAPTRELALQIHREGELLGKHTGLRLTAIYGGEGFNRQENALKSGTDVVIGTPGRLLDFMRRNILNLGKIQFLVIDEADRMLDLGFWDELRNIFRRLPPAEKRQSLLFSATLDRRTRSIAREFMNRPKDVEVRPDKLTAEGIDQMVYHVDRDTKFPLLLGILKKEVVPKGLIFTNMKITASWLVHKLKEHGFTDIGLLTGDLRQSARNHVLERFKLGKLPLLIASDVASRGLHIDDVTHIINYDVPQDPEDYVHRIGRTARAGKRGKAYTLACDQYVYSLPLIEELLADKIPSQIPYDEDFGEDQTPEFTIRKMMALEREEKRRRPQKSQPGRPRTGSTPRSTRQAQRSQSARPRRSGARPKS
jgi:ATP-dependent RNA helicase RhlB